jgi:hypothetical protein
MAFGWQLARIKWLLAFFSIQDAFKSLTNAGTPRISVQQILNLVAVEAALLDYS